MTIQPHFQPGQTIVTREVRNGKLLRAIPVTVVRDTPEIIALYAPLTTAYKYPLTPAGERVRPYQRLSGEWVLDDRYAEKYSSLRLAIPGVYYSVILFRKPDLSVHRWYINLEDPLERTAHGFIVRDHFLDVLVARDLSSWEWKDEDEFAEAIDLGMVHPEKAAFLRSEGQRVAEWICSGTSPFNEWREWRPDPAWPVPEFPSGWDAV